MRKPNILLVVLDSVRARNTSLHGHGNQTTPYLETLTKEAHVYEQARAPSIHSVSSHASIFTGLHVPEHGVTAHESELSPESTIWHELASEQGYVTGLFSPNVVVTMSSNLADAFTTVDGPRGDLRLRLFQDVLSPMDIEGHQTNTEYLRHCLNSNKPIRAILNGLYFIRGGSGGGDVDESAPVYVNSFLDWSASVDGPWAACLNLMDAHYPYVPKPQLEWGSKELRDIHDNTESPHSESITKSGDYWKLRSFESLYDGCIRQADAAVELLVESLRTRGDLKDTLVVITSDHGEGFGEWSRLNSNVRMVDHSWGIHEVLTHVPLLVRPPGEGDSHRRDALASLTRFPNVVRETILNNDPSFAVKNHALASTHRLKQPKKVLPESVINCSAYAGPWRAVYKTDDNGDVWKHATQGSNTISLKIPDAQSAIVYSSMQDNIINTVYGDLETTDIRVGERDKNNLDADIEQKLENLGYLR